MDQVLKEEGIISQKGRSKNIRSTRSEKTLGRREERKSILV